MLKLLMTLCTGIGIIGKIVCEIVLYPENSVKEGIRENNKWGFYAESFNQYLIKNNFSNWDHELKKDLLKELHKAGNIKDFESIFFFTFIFFTEKSFLQIYC